MGFADKDHSIVLMVVITCADIAGANETLRDAIGVLCKASG
jgi:hypothetical protein